MALSVSQIQQTSAERRAAEEAAYRKLYGDLLPAVELLRRRGYVVSREGGKFRVGNKLLDRAEVRALAQREGGLAGLSFTRKGETAGGLKVGHVEKIAPRAARSAGGRASDDGSAHPAAARAPRPLSGAAKAAKARADEHSAELGTRPRVVWLDLGLLEVDRRYQREINKAGEAHINRILKGFNWNRYQPIIVTEGEGGRYAVIDGQHRLEAAKKHPLIDALPCYIIDAPEMAAQAEIFVAVNSDRRGLTGLQKFWASHAAANREAVALVEACAAAGVTIPRTTPAGGLAPRTIVGPNVVLRHVGQHGRAAVQAAIGLLAEAWPAAKTGFRVPNLGAIATIASTPYGRDRLLRTLKRLDPDKLYAQALAAVGSSSTVQITAAIAKIVRAAMERV